MTHIHFMGRWIWVVSLVMLLHVAAFWLAGRKPSPRVASPDPVQWIDAVVLQPGPPPVSAPAPVAMPAYRRPAPAAADQRKGPADAPAGQTLEAVPPAPAAHDEPVRATPAQPPLDLSPEALGRALRAGAVPSPAAAHHGTGRAPEPFGLPPGPARLSESVGASGSRVTRVETPWGNYCVRTPAPGRAPAGGAGPELALPTNCP